MWATIQLASVHTEAQTKWPTFLQMIFSNSFSSIKMFIFWLKFHWSLFLGVQLTVSQYWSDNGLVLNRQQAITWTNDDTIHWHMCLPASVLTREYIDGLVWDCSISIASTLEILQSCAKPSIYCSTAAGSAVLTLISPDAYFRHSPTPKKMTLPWKTDLFKGILHHLCMLDLTLLDEESNPVWTVRWASLTLSLSVRILAHCGLGPDSI